jgi:hypothetical protein
LRLLLTLVNGGLWAAPSARLTARSSNTRLQSVL